MYLSNFAVFLKEAFLLSKESMLQAKRSKQEQQQPVLGSAMIVSSSPESTRSPFVDTAGGRKAVTFRKESVQSVDFTPVIERAKSNEREAEELQRSFMARAGKIIILSFHLLVFRYNAQDGSISLIFNQVKLMILGVFHG